MFEIKNVSKVYTKKGVKAVDSINLTVNNGEIFGFLGWGLMVLEKLLPSKW